MSKDLRSAVVRITHTDEQGRAACTVASQRNPVGTGFVFAKVKNAVYILTCKHVVDDVRKRLSLAAGSKVNVWINWQFQATPIFESSPTGPDDIERDLAVLQCSEAALQERDPLLLRWPLGIKIPRIVSYQSEIPGGQREEVATVAPYQLATQFPSTFRLKNDVDYHIGPNHSGSPVIDDKDRVIGVVTRVTATERGTAEEKDRLVVAISIEQLIEQWKDAPLDLIAEPLPHDVSRGISDPAQRVGPVRVRLLAVTIESDEGAAFDDELAVIQEVMLRRLPQGSEIEAWCWEDSGKVRCLFPLERRGERRPSPAFTWFDVIVLVTSDSAAEKTIPARVASAFAKKDATRLRYRRGERKADSNPTYKDYKAREFASVFGPDLERLLGTFQSIGTFESRPPNPYRGLAGFMAEHGALFNGRASDTAELRSVLANETHRFVIVTGASGSGKSSLVRAGLFPRLQLDGIKGSSQWPIVEIRLSNAQAPLRIVADALFQNVDAKRLYASSVELETDLHDSTGVDKIVAAVVGDSGRKLVIFLDQFEELFTLVPEENRQHDLLRFLRDAALHPDVYVLVTIRSDFYHRFVAHQLAPSSADQYTLWLQALEEASLVEAMYWPAAISGYYFEDTKLFVDILRDAGSDIGSLPLLSYALEQLAERASKDLIMTSSSYREMGGVKGVINNQIETALRSLPRPPTQDVLGNLFRRLVTVDESGTATKKPAIFDPNDGSWAAEAVDLARVLVTQRLLLTDSREGHSVIEIAHEALLSNWDELRTWIANSRDALISIQTVERAAREWQAARDVADDESGKLLVDRERLWSQDRLNDVKKALELLGQSRTELSLHAQAFLRPEAERLIEELQSSATEHARRGEIGDRLAVLGDPRPGVGLREGRIPDMKWLPVPGGQIRILDVQQAVVGVFEVQPFYIAQYPITLQQFNAFTQGAIYYNKKWWTGLPIVPEEHTPFPQTPMVVNHPAQFVSWFQAMAFCAWLTEQLGYPVRLPTEAEWVQAATGGRADYLYPWGPDWDPTRANHREGARRLMSAGMYPNGQSPVGAYDMSGNMYQWCLGEFDHPENVQPSKEPRTTRGGAFFTPPPVVPVQEQLSVRHRLRDNADGIRERGQRVAVCIRLVCEKPFEVRGHQL